MRRDEVMGYGSLVSSVSLSAGRGGQKKKKGLEREDQEEGLKLGLVGFPRRSGKGMGRGEPQAERNKNNNVLMR